MRIAKINVCVTSIRLRSAHPSAYNPGPSAANGRAALQIVLGPSTLRERLILGRRLVELFGKLDVRAEQASRVEAPLTIGKLYIKAAFDSFRVDDP